MARRRTTRSSQPSRATLEAAVAQPTAEELEDAALEGIEELVEEAEATPVEEVDETPKTPQGIRPEDLARELGISGKQIRGWLRATFPRPLEQKRSSWYLTEKQAQAVRDHFAPPEDDEEDVAAEA